VKHRSLTRALLIGGFFCATLAVLAVARPRSAAGGDDPIRRQRWQYATLLRVFPGQPGERWVLISQGKQGDAASSAELVERIGVDGGDRGERSGEIGVLDALGDNGWELVSHAAGEPWIDATRAQRPAERWIFKRVRDH